MKTRRAVELLNPMRDKNRRQEAGGIRDDDTCDHGLPRNWRVNVGEKKKKEGQIFRGSYLRRRLGAGAGGGGATAKGAHHFFSGAFLAGRAL